MTLFVSILPVWVFVPTFFACPRGVLDFWHLFIHVELPDLHTVTAFYGMIRSEIAADLRHT